MNEHVGEPVHDGDERDPEERAERSREEDREHLRDLEAGAGCTEIWEHLSEHREED